MIKIKYIDKTPIQGPIKLKKTKLPKLEEMTEKEIEYLKKDNHLEYYIKLLKEEKHGEITKNAQ